MEKNDETRRYFGYISMSVKDIPEGYPRNELTDREVVNFEKQHLKAYLRGDRVFYYKKGVYEVAQWVGSQEKLNKMESTEEDGE